MKRIFVCVPLIGLLAAAVLGVWTGSAFPQITVTAAAPQITDTDPNPPANDNSPLVKGSADPGSTVTLYESPDCTGAVEDQGSAAAFASPGLSASVADDATATFSATATDGSTSPCSGPFDYREDSTAPETQIDSGPTGATSDTTPDLRLLGRRGGLELRMPLRLRPVRGLLGAGPKPHRTERARRRRSHVRGQGLDQAQNTDQTPASRNLMVDTQAPAPPQITDTEPDSPANDNTPQVKGTSSGTTVRLYKTACTGAPIAQGPAGRFATPGFFTTVADNTTTSFRATAIDAAGNTSGCSAAFQYVEDSNPPAAPHITTLDPRSPANDNTPQITGSAEAGTIVRLYKTAGCVGAPVAQGPAARFASPGFSVSVSNNTTTAFRATATDAAGSSSACSAARAYIEDSAPPAGPQITDTNPDSPANHNNPRVKGTATGSTTVKLYATTCTGSPVAQGSAAQFASPGLGASVPDNTTTTFRATATDAAGNTSPCSAPRNYVEDSTAPFAGAAVDGGEDFTCGVQHVGTLACWGSNSFGQSSPPSGTFTAVSAGAIHACGLRSNGTLTCWGANGRGQATPPPGPFTAVSAGAYHTCGVKTDGTLACWGRNGSGQATPPPGAFTAVSAGSIHTCGIKANGTLACWGDNGFGRATPRAGTFSAVSVGHLHTCGIRTGGTLACWGRNTEGQSSPPAGTFTAVSAGKFHTCGIRTSGTLACWGRTVSARPPLPRACSPR